jgi:hypothetical protein
VGETFGASAWPVSCEVAWAVVLAERLNVSAAAVVRICFWSFIGLLVR